MDQDGGTVMLAAVLALTMAGAEPAARPVSVYVGPIVKDGYAVADRGVLDSIKDIRKRLLKDRSVRVAEREADARVRLYVVERRQDASPDSITTVIPGTTITVPGVAPKTITIGSSTITLPGTPDQHYTTASTSITTQGQALLVVAVLRVDDHEHVLSAQGASWGGVAKQIAKDLGAWLDANRERIGPKE